MNTRRPRAKRGQGEHLRTEILDAAEAILHETGSADKVSTRAVAQRVGCSSPSIYLHFPDRAQMLFAVCERQFELLASQIRVAADAEPEPVDRLRAIARTYCEFALANQEQYRTMMMDTIAGAAYEQTLEAMRTELGFDVLYETVQAGVDANVFAAVDPLRASFNLWCTVHGVVSLMIAKPSIEWGDDRALYEGAIDQSIVGLLARPSGPLTRKVEATQVAAKKVAAKKAAAKKAGAKKPGATKTAAPPTAAKTGAARTR